MKAHNFETAVWLNNGNGTFSKRDLPVQAQFAPVYAILVEDFTSDGILDILVGGNQLRAKPETGVYAGSYGLLLKGDSKGNFTSVPAAESGLSIHGEIRALKKIGGRSKRYVLVGKNNEPIQILSYKM